MSSKLLSAGFGFITIMGCGYALMTATTPTEEQLYAKMSPDLRRKIDESRQTPQGRAERQAQLDYLKNIAESDKPVWQNEKLTPEQKRQL